MQNKKIILVIDDEKEMRTFLRDTLEQEGYEIIEAEDGFDGMEKFSANHVDLVITDLIMPRMEGVETITSLAAKHPSVKVIAISGAPYSDTYLKMVKKLGVCAGLEKPFSRREIVSTVTDVLPP